MLADCLLLTEVPSSGIGQTNVLYIYICNICTLYLFELLSGQNLKFAQLSALCPSSCSALQPCLHIVVVYIDISIPLISVCAFVYTFATDR